MSGGDALASAWPLERAGEVIEALARRAGLSSREVAIPLAPSDANGEGLDRWIQNAAGWLGLEAEPVAIGYSELSESIGGAAPALIQIPSNGSQQPQFLALAKSAGQRAAFLLGPDGVERRASLPSVHGVLCGNAEASVAGEIDRLLDAAQVNGKRRASARAKLMSERLAAKRVSLAWLLRDDPGVSLWRSAKQARLLGRMGRLATAHLFLYLLGLLGWWLIGRALLEGRFDRGLLVAWLLLLLTLIPIQLLISQLSARLSIDAGAVLKQRLFAGALRLIPDSVRHQGAGQLLSQVFDTEAVESLAIGGAFLGLMAIIELAIAGAVIALGAGGLPHVLALLGWTVFAALLTWRYFGSCQRWTQQRLTMTHDLVERMVGHRTRLAQEQAEHWHEAEDQTLERYLEQSRALDGAAVYLEGWVPRGWLVLGILCLFPAFARGDSATALAIGIGGTLLAYRALRRLTASLSRLATAAIACQNVANLFRAAADAEPHGPPGLAKKESPANGRVLLEAHELTFRYADRAGPVLRGCNLEVRQGEHLLLEGPSGAGKSTLASLLVGLRTPSSGLLLLDGLDRHTLGGAWRHRVVAAPQFHENHVFLAPFSFNLLVGREWPPSEADLREAAAICRELGLGPLLKRMPAGLHQMVGETGWQLSHGERSRLYIARALLQGADLVILDESFAALDPETLQCAMECVLKRAKTLLVVAHR